MVVVAHLRDGRAEFSLPNASLPLVEGKAHKRPRFALCGRLPRNGVHRQEGGKKWCP